MSKIVFKGTINGKNFSDENEFNEHLKRVINERNLSVEKSFELVESDDDQKVENTSEENPVQDEHKVSNRNNLDLSRLRDGLDESNRTFFGDYILSTELVSDIMRCDNKDEVKAEINKLIEDEETKISEAKNERGTIQKEIDSYNQKISEIKSDISKLNERMVGLSHKIRTSNDKISYYNDLKDYAFSDNKQPRELPWSNDLYDAIKNMLMF